MKNLKVVFVLFFILQLDNIFAGHAFYNGQTLYFNGNLSEFRQKSDWINLDSSIDYISSQLMQYQGLDPQDNTTLQPVYFDEFDYIPETSNVLIRPEDIKDLIFIKNENDVQIQVVYTDAYGNDISENYPKLYYKKYSSADPWTEIVFNNAGTKTFLASATVDYGIYDYYVAADNLCYPGEYLSDIKTFAVTERPHSFVNLNTNLQDEKGNPNTNIEFRWTASKGVEGDILKYTLYLGSDLGLMKIYDLSTQNTYTAENLSARTRYYWKVEVENQYGAQLLGPVLFSFVTLGEIARVYNAPNPFNPQKGEKTRIFFEMPQSGSAQIDVYSEYGDKIYHLSADNLPQGSNEIVYDGKDDFGKNLYNGTYLCIVKKKFSGQTKVERCRLLVIK